MNEQHTEPAPERSGTDPTNAETTSPPESGRTDTAPEEPGARSPNREAAKYRKERNDARGERDALREQIDTIHRAEVERRAAERFTDPRDVWAVTSLDQLRGEDGLIDLGKVEAEFGRIEQDRPHWKRREFPEVHHGPRRSATEPEKPSFGAAIRKTLGGS